MTTLDYDDPIAFERRWGRLSHAQATELSRRDPLLFVADHVSIDDRGPGSLAVYAEMAGSSPTIIVIKDGLLEPSADDCLTAVASIAGKLCDQVGFDIEDALVMEPPLRRLGLVLHRRGMPHVRELDVRWAQALADGCDMLHIEPVGVLVRTEGGALVRIPMPEGRRPDAA